MENSPTVQTTLAGALAFEIQKRREQALAKKINAYPRSMSILSDISECERQMVYAVTNWKDRPLQDVELQALFDEGKYQEQRMNRELIDLGFEIIAQQEVVEIKNRKGEVIARGRIDGKIVYQKFKIPYEAKMMNQYIFDSLESIDDFQKKPHLRKYVRQLMMYLFGSTSLKDPEYEGLFLCTDGRGHWKQFVLSLDYGEAEQTLQRLERVDTALKAGILPERIEYRDEICGYCPFVHICLPDILRKEAAVIIDEELIGRLERRDILKPSVSEYDKLDKSIKADLKARIEKSAIAGDFVIKITKREYAERVTPPGTMTIVDIKRMGDITNPKVKEMA
jgi:hypothetical protein